MTLIDSVEQDRIDMLVGIIKPELSQPYHGRVVLALQEDQAKLLVAYLERLRGLQATSKL